MHDKNRFRRDLWECMSSFMTQRSSGYCVVARPFSSSSGVLPSEGFCSFLFQQRKCLCRRQPVSVPLFAIRAFDNAPNGQQCEQIFCVIEVEFGSARHLRKTQLVAISPSFEKFANIRVVPEFGAFHPHFVLPNFDHHWGRLVDAVVFSQKSLPARFGSVGRVSWRLNFYKVGAVGAFGHFDFQHTQVAVLPNLRFERH